MIELHAHGSSYRAIAKEMDLARTTVMRMKVEAARYSAFLQSLLASDATLAAGHRHR